MNISIKFLYFNVANLNVDIVVFVYHCRTVTHIYIHITHINVKYLYKVNRFHENTPHHRYIKKKIHICNNIDSDFYRVCNVLIP